MEAFGLYLLKSVAWLSGFTLIYFLFLRNERFFSLNRIYLLTGILASIFFPFISVHYNVEVPYIQTAQTGEIAFGSGQNPGIFKLEELGIIMLMVYISGALVVISLLFLQSKSLIRLILKAEINQHQPVKLIKSAEFSSPFSFFSYVFINPSTTELETREIVNHEMVHISQKHWFDLLLVQLLCMIQWFNPLVWVYVRFIRQNHEFLADEIALQRSSHPAIYKAALLNQIAGSPVINLANSFNDSITRKRFNMMKNIIRSPYRKMKLLLILPVFAIILYSFAKPDYKYITPSGSTSISNTRNNEVKGTITEKAGNPLSGAAIIIQGSTTGTISDEKGKFLLTGVPDDARLVISFAGYKTKVLLPDFKSEMNIVMIQDTIRISDRNSLTPPPPPPPPLNATTPDLPSVDTPPPPPPPFSWNGPAPLIVIDGKISDEKLSDINQDSIASIAVLNEEAAKKAYGEKGKNGVLQLTTKKKSTVSNITLEGKNDTKIYKVTKNQEKGEVKVIGKDDKTIYRVKEKPEKELTIIEEILPSFPNGDKAMTDWILQNIKYPPEAAKKRISGKVEVSFIVTSKGKLTEVKVTKSVDPLLDAEAKRIISNMPDWVPGSQNGKPVDMWITVPIQFALR